MRSVFGVVCPRCYGKGWIDETIVKEEEFSREEIIGFSIGGVLCGVIGVIAGWGIWGFFIAGAIGVSIEGQIGAYVMRKSHHRNIAKGSEASSLASPSPIQKAESEDLANDLTHTSRHSENQSTGTSNIQTSVENVAQVPSKTESSTLRMLCKQIVEWRFFGTPKCVAIVVCTY